MCLKLLNVHLLELEHLNVSLSQPVDSLALFLSLLPISLKVKDFCLKLGELDALVCILKAQLMKLLWDCLRFLQGTMVVRGVTLGCCGSFYSLGI